MTIQIDDFKTIANQATVLLGIFAGLTITQDMFEHSDQLASDFLECAVITESSFPPKSAPRHCDVFVSSYYFMVSAIAFMFLSFGVAIRAVAIRFFGYRRKIVYLVWFFVGATILSYTALKIPQINSIANHHNIGNFVPSLHAGNVILFGEINPWIFVMVSPGIVIFTIPFLWMFIQGLLNFWTWMKADFDDDAGHTAAYHLAMASRALSGVNKQSRNEFGNQIEIVDAIKKSISSSEKPS